MSFFGILDYNYDGRYYLQGSLRYDGSSLLAPTINGFILVGRSFMEYP
jgi:hypothetical protein